MQFLITFKRFLRRLAVFLILALLAGLLGAFGYAALLPRLATWSWTSQFAWPNAGTHGPTVIERTEQVILSQEEGLERFSESPRTAVVRIVSQPVDRLGRIIGKKAPAQSFTGILVTNDGIIATYTNEPLRVEGQRVTTFFSDGSISEARFLAYDSSVNVAYFQTDRTNTPTLSFANSQDVRPGRRLMVLSAASEASGTRLAAGYVSEYARTFNLSGKTVASTDKWEGVLLPDRTFEPTFLGGAVVAMNGELIGLVGSLRLDTVDHSFILPSNALRQSLQRVIQNTGAPRASVGAYYVSLTPEVALSLDISENQGAMIYTPSENTSLAVIAGSRAEKAGLRYGDIVTKVGDREIDQDWPLSVALAEQVAEDIVKLTVLRDGKELRLSLKR